MMAPPFSSISIWRCASNLIACPDVAYVSATRLAEVPPPVTGPYPGAPDLAVEFADLDDPREQLARINRYLTAGCGVVWLLQPHVRSAVMYRVGGNVVVVPPGKHLTGAPALPRGE